MHGKRDTGLKVCTGSGMSEKTILMTGLRENLSQDDGIGCLPISVNRKLKQQRRRRLRERHSKSEFALPQTLSHLFHLI